MPAMRRLPFTVIGGFLGAGKTTLLNRLLRETKGRRFAVLVNDFGAIDIDSRLVTAHGGDTISLANGCICCSIGDSLVLALVRVLDRADAIDHVVVEASGVADPARIAELAAIEPMLERDGVLVVVDASSVRDREADHHIGDTVRRQLDGADLLVLNKTDLIGADEQADVVRWLRNRNPGTRILPTSRANVSTGALFGLPLTGAPASSVDSGPAIRRWSLSTRHLIDRAGLMSALQSLPQSVLRAKGIVRLADAPLLRSTVHVVGRYIEIRSDAPWGIADLRSDLVVLGTPDMPDDTMLACRFAPAVIADTSALQPLAADQNVSDQGRRSIS